MRNISALSTKQGKACQCNAVGREDQLDEAQVVLNGLADFGLRAEDVHELQKQRRLLRQVQLT